MSKTKNAIRTDGSIDADKLDIKKAGFVVYGRNADGQLCILSTYVQGRYTSDGSDANKYYGLPKGSVENEEDPITGGKREAREETGISIKKLIGEENMRRLRKKEDGVPYKGEHYKGVNVVKAYARPSDFAYLSASGTARRMNMFFIEVDNIEALDVHPDMKRPPASPEELKLVERFTWERSYLPSTMTAVKYCKQNNYPTLVEMLDILRTGKLAPTEQHPANLAWVPSQETTVIDHPILAEWEQEWAKDNKRHITQITRKQDWVEFCKYMEQKHPDVYKDLEKHFLKLKGYFTSAGICGDRNFIKLDEKDIPLNFFFEGGEVIPLTHFLTRSAQLAYHNEAYRDSMWGEYSGPRMPEVRGEMQKSYTAQVGGVLPRDGQQLRDSDAYSIDEAINILTTIEDGMKLAGKAEIGQRIVGLRNVLQADRIRS